MDHTADTGLEATADSLPQLIEELATGMFGLMAEVDRRPQGRTVEANLEAASDEELIVDILSELLYLSETEGLHFCRFDVTHTGDHAVRIAASGVPAGAIESDGPAIKAVTYHDLEVSGSSQGWYGRVYFDV